MMVDPLNAFFRNTHVAISGAETGPLAELTFAAKDVFDIVGHRTGAGNPDWLQTHPPESATAPAVQCLLNAGATLVGKTQTDELTYSLNGENVHYGTPINPRAPGRIPGGSSSGSAVAVAGNLVDFSLGTDCGGSVRLPASYCGLFGFRPSHDRIPLTGVFPLAQSFDTVGWFARDAKLLERVGRILIEDNGVASMPCQLLIATDAFDLLDGAIAQALEPAIAQVAAIISEPKTVTLSPEGLFRWLSTFRVLQGYEIWANHGDWIQTVQPTFGTEIQQRFEQAAAIAPTDLPAAQQHREEITAYFDKLLEDGTILCLPTAPGIAPLRNTPSDELTTFRFQALSLLCIAGLARLPQVNLPLATFTGCPLGLSLIGARNTDIQLLALAATLND